MYTSFSLPPRSPTFHLYSQHKPPWVGWRTRGVSARLEAWIRLIDEAHHQLRYYLTPVADRAFTRRSSREARIGVACIKKWRYILFYTQPRRSFNGTTHSGVASSSRLRDDGLLSGITTSKAFRSLNTEKITEYPDWMITTRTGGYSTSFSVRVIFFLEAAAYSIPQKCH